MLVLTRLRQQSVTLTLPHEPVELLALAGEEITVTVCGVDRGAVKLGLHAPQSVLIVRDDSGPRKEQ